MSNVATAFKPSFPNPAIWTAELIAKRQAEFSAFEKTDAGIAEQTAFDTAYQEYEARVITKDKLYTVVDGTTVQVHANAHDAAKAFLDANAANRPYVISVDPRGYASTPGQTMVEYDGQRKLSKWVGDCDHVFKTAYEVALNSGDWTRRSHL